MKSKQVILAVIVAALGYFVDIYDLLLFSIVRQTSLIDLGLGPSEITEKGLLLLDMQMGGMLLGGVLFGILGDKKGRLSILFGSILLYSVANILNGFVQSVPTYAFLRLIAGVGLAGELGAGISLVSELMPRKLRGYGTLIVASVGVCGAILAYFVAAHFSWRHAYFIGGTMGLALLMMRVSLAESQMFSQLSESPVKRGDFLSLFTNWDRGKRYATCIFIGLQFWFVVGIAITLSPEFAKHLGVTGPIVAGKSVLYMYAGLVIGDLASGLLSQFLQSRKKALAIFMVCSSVINLLYFCLWGVSPSHFYWYCLVIGIFSGYWALFATVAAESFGTNLRATVATTAPNFVRGSLVPISILFATLKASLGFMGAAVVVYLICIGISLFALAHLKETFHSDLNYLES